jgi:hypothetical protein
MYSRQSPNQEEQRVSPLEGAAIARGRVSDRFQAYLPWNEAIAHVVFSEAVAGEPVFLDLEDDVLRAVAETVGGGLSGPREALVQVVRSTLNLAAGGQSLFSSHIAMLSNWDRSSGDPPPVLGLLGVLSLAALDMRDGDGFAANNYYDRLMPLLDIDTDSGKQRAIRSYRDCSALLWDALNDWLLDWQGERGLPTAYAINPAHAHVGRPMSQALLRASDRARLLDFFTELHLPPRCHLPHQDMEVLLDEWIDRPITAASHTLRLMWSHAEARDRITECACQLLEAWDGTSAVSDGGPRTKRVYLTALLRTFPASSLEFNIVASGPDAEIGDVEVLDGDATIGHALPTEGAPGSRWRLADPSILEPSSMLEGLLRLRADDSVYERRPRRVVAFRKDSLLHSYLEVERLPLGESTIILCKDELCPSLEEALACSARPGFARRSDVSGCPAGWTLYADVQILGDLPEFNPSTGQRWRFELNVLQPIASSQLALEGGMHLPGRLHRWSSLCPPEVVVVSDTPGALEIHLGRQQSVGNTVLHTREFSTSPAVWPLAELNLPDGDYQVVVTSARAYGQHHAESRSLRLRSADMPWPGGAAPTLRRPLHGGYGALGAHANVDKPHVTGPRVEATIDDTASEGAADTALPGWWAARRAPDQNATPERDLIRIPAVSGTDCFHTGAHVIQLPTFYGKRTSKIVKGVCRHCGLLKRYPTWLGRTPEKPPKAELTVAASSKPTFKAGAVTVVPISGASTTTNVAFDAMCYLRAGPATHLEQLAVQIDPSALFTDAFIRAAESLGHIEVERHHRTFTIGAWEVMPPSLVELPSGSIVLTGRRSHAFVEHLTMSVKDLGGELDVTAQPAAPDRVRVTGLTLEAAELVADELRSKFDLDVAVVPSAAQRLAASLPPLSALVSSLPHQAMPSYRSAKRWDATTARWRPTTDASVPGVYQLASVTMIYAIRDEADVERGTMRRGDARLVKHAAADATGERLVGYDEASLTLYMPLGSELPLLYGRAAVLASGMMPEPDPGQGMITYRSVPADLAAQLMLLVMS